MAHFAAGIPLGPVMQICHVVENLEAEMERWTGQLGIGPFFVLKHFPVQGVTYRGKPADVDIDVAVAFSGSTCFELIRQNDRKPSVFREVVDARGYGFHHWAVATRSFDAELARRTADGTAVAASAVTGLGARVAYLDTLKALGGMTEIIELNAGVEQFFGMIHAAAEAWDGQDPVRVLGPA